MVHSPNTVWYLKLNKGRYNGQKKIALHPAWNGKEVNIAILQFVDPAGSIFTGENYNAPATSSEAPAQLILNSGGQTLNLIYIDNDDNLDNNLPNIADRTGGYWMLLDNNFDFI